MKKKKKILCFVLIAALCLGLTGVLAGCSKTQKTNEPSQQGGPAEPSGSAAPSGSSTPAPAPGPETYVYTASYVPLKEQFTNGVNPMAFVDGRFLASAYVLVRSEIPEGVTPEYEGQYDVYENRFFWIDLDGTVEPLSGYVPVVESGDNQGSYIINLQLTGDGKLLAVEDTYRSWYDGPEDVEMYSQEFYEKGYYEYQHWEENYYLRILNKDGSEEARVDLKPLQEKLEEEGSYFSPYNFTSTPDGKLLMNGDSCLLVVDKEGNLEQKIELGNWVETMMLLSDGRIAVAYYGEEGEVMAILDPATLQPIPEQTYRVSNVYNATPGGGDYDFYYNNGSNFMGFKLGQEKPEKLLNWINADVNPSDLNRCYVTDDGRVVGLQTEWTELEDDNGNIYSSKSESSILIMTKVPASSVAQKQVLTLAVMWLDYEMQEQVVKFNRSSPDTRIEILDYSEYNTPDDYSAGQTKLNTEIMAGNLPDILNLSGISWNKLAARGFLTDLKPYLDADPELNGQIFDNVLRALETEGKLYRTAANFSVQSYVGAASVVGDTPGWNLAEFNAALKKMPAGCEPFGMWMNRETVLNLGLGLEMNKLIDWSTGKCTFDTPRFTDILKLAAQFPKEVDYEDYQWSEDDEEPNRIATGRQMLMQAWMSDFSDVQMYDAVFGGNATYIGFPTSEGVGNAISFNDEGYAITSKCRNKDAAWQFLRTLFTESYQNRSWGFPTNKNAFRKSLERAMTPQYQTDMNGNFVLDEDGNKIEISQGGYGWGAVEIEYKALSQEQADKIMQLIESTDRSTNYDEEIMQMIIADCEPFFAGQKTAEEVGRLLQSKMTIYINEQR